MRSGIDGVLTSLPPAFVIAGRGDARLVMGPSGAFVLLPAGRERVLVEQAADHLIDLVMTTRMALCDHLTWVPFLDALLVTNAEPPRGADVTAVPLDLVHDVLVEGPVMITSGTLNGLREVVRTSRLAGWHIGFGADLDRIDLSDRGPRPSAPSSSTR